MSKWAAGSRFWTGLTGFTGWGGWGGSSKLDPCEGGMPQGVGRGRGGDQRDAEGMDTDQALADAACWARRSRKTAGYGFHGWYGFEP